MDTNAKTQQINTFLKGMNSDTSDALLSDELYRFAKNLRYVTDVEENTGELRLIEGALYLNQIPSSRYIIASTTIRDCGVLLTYNTDNDSISPNPDVNPDDPYAPPQPREYIVDLTCTAANKYFNTDYITDQTLPEYRTQYNFVFTFYVNNEKTPTRYSGTELPILVVYQDNTSETISFVQVFLLSESIFSHNSDKVIKQISIDNLQPIAPAGTGDSYVYGDITETTDICDTNGNITHLTSGDETGGGGGGQDTSPINPNDYTIGYRLVNYTNIPLDHNPLEIEADVQNFYQLELVVLSGNAGQNINTTDNKSTLIDEITLSIPYYPTSTIEQTLLPGLSNNLVYTNMGTNPNISFRDIDEFIDDFSPYHPELIGANVRYEDGHYIYKGKNYWMKRFQNITLDGEYPYSTYADGGQPSPAPRRRTRRRARRISDDSVKSWSIYVYDNNSNSLQLILLSNISIGNQYLNKPSIAAFWENNQNLKLYIADGEHEILVANVLKYYGLITDLKTITNVGATALSPITNITPIAGQLYSGIVAYAYRLYNHGSTTTDISPLSKFLIVSSSNGGLEYGKRTNKGFLLNIPQVSGFNKVLVFRVTYLLNGYLPTIELIIDRDFTNTIVADYGQLALSTLTLEEFTSSGGIKFVPKVIEIKDGYLFAGDINYLESKYVETFQGWIASAEATYFNGDLSTATTSENNSTSGSGRNISWQLVVNQNTIDSNILNSIINDSELRSSTTNLKSLRRDEIYRYGIILYGDDGYKSPVKWIMDVRTPSILQLDSGYSDIITIDNNRLTANNLGILFTVNNLPTGCIGFEIVRCNRSSTDRATITQGVISRTFETVTRLNAPEGSPAGSMMLETVCPTGLINAGIVRLEFRVGEKDEPITTVSTAYSSNSIYLIFSPEISYLSDDIKNLFDSASLLYLSPCYIARQQYYTCPVAKYIDYSKQRFLHDSQDVWYLYHQVLELDDVSYNTASLDFDQFYTVRKMYANGGNVFQKAGAPANTKFDFNESNIANYAFPTVKRWDSLADNAVDAVLNYSNDVTNVGTKNYLSWAMPAALAGSESDIRAALKASVDDDKMWRNARIDIGGKCAVLLLSGDQQFANFALRYLDSQGSDDAFLYDTILCNIRQQVTPYGGFTSDSRNASTYYGHGQYFKHTTGDNPQTVTVFDGDTFIRCFECSSTYHWSHSIYQAHVGAEEVYIIPVETDIDTSKDYGDTWSKNRNALILYEPAQVAAPQRTYIQTKPHYQYNTAYSIDPAVEPHYMQSSTSTSTVDKSYDYRVHYSNRKTVNESVDSLTMFQPLNYIDVDTKYGKITDLRKFHNQLVFWQEGAVGLLSVNERTQITDDSNLPLILGTGGVLSRFDYINTKGGMIPNIYAETQSDSTLYWWDYDHNEIYSYNEGTTATPLSKVKNILNLLKVRADKQWLLDNPLLTYDKLYNEVLFTISSNNNSPETIVYNELVGAFTSTYTIDPVADLQFTDRLIITNNSLLFLWNVVNTAKKSYGISYSSSSSPDGFGSLLPYLKYIINDNLLYTKVYDNVEFGGRFYGGGDFNSLVTYASTLDSRIKFLFSTPLKLKSNIDGKSITNRQYDFKFVVPRDLGDENKPSIYGDRLRGKTMQCEMSSTSNSLDFSLQYIITKYRISWS